MANRSSVVASPPRFFARYRAELREALKRGVSTSGLGLYDMLRYHMGWADSQGRPHLGTEGKALRPTLCVFACEAVGGSWHVALPAAVALEFIHNFSLIHDDIQDEDEERHHRPTLWYLWGKSNALVAGNVLRLLADMSLWSLRDGGLSTAKTVKACGLLSQAYLEMIEGQYLDLSYEGRFTISMGDYLDMIAKKTGSLISCSLHVGALIGSDDADTIEAFRKCGQALGQAFQIWDDCLGIWGDEKATGKPVGADIRRKKNSFPVVYTMARAEETDKETLTSIYSKTKLEDGDVNQVLAIMEQVEARQSSQRLAEERSLSALEALSGVELAPVAKRELEDLVEFLLTRQY